MAEVKGKEQKRVWIDSQTEEEIIRGIKEAKELSAYDNLSASAYLRAKEDYLMGINFSRLLTLEYGNTISNYMGFAVPMEQVVRIHASSGTTGKPTVVGYTQNDIDNWANIVARSLRAAVKL